MTCLYCSWQGAKHADNCPVNMLQEIIQYEINNNSILIGRDDMPVCRFCGVRGRWEDTGPVFVAHHGTCLIVKYNKYLQEWK